MVMLLEENKFSTLQPKCATDFDPTENPEGTHMQTTDIRTNIRVNFSSHRKQSPNPQRYSIQEE